MSVENGEISFEDLVLKNNESLESNGVITFTEEDFGKTNFNEEEKEEGKEKEVTTTEVKTDEDKPKPEEEKPEIVATAVVGNNFTSIAKKLLEKGEWKDFIIEGEDGKETKFSDLESLDEETFMTVWKEQQSFAKEDLDKNYIPVKGIEENRLALINILKNGGDLKEIFKDESQMRRPYEGLDLSVQQNQQNVLYQQYLNQGLTSDEAKDLVIKATKDLTLSARSEQIVKFYQESYDTNLKEIEKKTAEERTKELESIKEYKKSLVTLYKEEELEDSLGKVLAESATKKTADGQLYIDTVYEEIMKDPQKAKDLVFFMLEKDKFLAKRGASIKKEVTINNMKKIKLVQDNTKTVAPKEEEKENSPFGDIILK